jgi:maleate isomerase
MLLSCTNLRTIEIIETLEGDFGIPVVSNNQASLWAALRGTDYKKAIKGFDQLLADY